MVDKANKTAKVTIVMDLYHGALGEIEGVPAEKWIRNMVSKAIAPFVKADRGNWGPTNVIVHVDPIK